MSDFKTRLIAILSKHEPDKVSKADAYLKQYAGKEEALIKSLCKKHNEPYVAPAGAAAAPTTPRSAEPAPAAAATPPAAAAAAPAAAAAGGGDDPAYKERLLVLLHKHEPDKVSKVDAYLKQYAGKEEALLKSLAKKYNDVVPPTPRAGGGSAPAAAATTPAATPAQTPRAPETPKPAEAAAAAPAGDDFKTRLIAILSKHEPDKVSKADAYLKQYAGKEEALIKSLCKKHNEPYTAPGSTTPRSGAAAETPRATETAAAPAAAVAATPAPEPAAVAAAPAAPDFKTRLIAILSKHEPDKVSKADAYLKQYAGKEEALLKSLAKKHNEPYVAPAGAAAAAGSESAGVTPRAAEPAPTPAPAVVAAPAPAPAAAAAAPLSDLEKLRRVFLKHEPEKVDKAARFLAQYAGKEKAMFSSMAKKYNDPAIATPEGPDMTGVADPAAAAAAPAVAAAAPVAAAEKPKQVAEKPAVEEPAAAMPANDSSDAMADATPDSNVSGATTPRSTHIGESIAAPRSIPAAAAEPAASAKAAPAAAVPGVLTQQDKRRVDRSSAAQLAMAGQFYQQRIVSELRQRWFRVWRAAGQRKVAQRLQAATKSEQPVSAELVDALGQCRINPGAWARVRFLRAQLQLPEAAPRDVAGVALAVDEAVATAFEFVTEKHDREIQAVQEAAAAEMHKMAALLQKAHEAAATQEREASAATDRAKLLDMHLHEAEAEIESLRGQLDAQVRLTQRATQSAKKLEVALEKEQRGVPSDLEQRLEQKDELAAHLHKQLAAARSSTNGYKEQCERLMAELAEERDRRVRAEQRVEVLSVALLPPEALGVTSSNGSGSVARPMSIAESVRNARAAREQQTQREQQQAEFHLSPHPGTGEATRTKTYAEQAQLMAAARKALLTEGSATGGDVPRMLMAYHGRSSNNAAVGGSFSAGSTPRDPSPPSAAPPSHGATTLLGSPEQQRRLGLNQTPAAEGAAQQQQQQYGGSAADSIASPSPAAPAAQHADPESSGGLSSDPLGHVNCPNCETVKLTAFNGARFSTNASDKDKVAFCFSCRKTFSLRDLEQMAAAKNRASHNAAAAAASASSANRGPSHASAASSSVARGVGAKGGAAGAAAAPRLTYSQQRAAKIPEHLRNNVQRLASQRSNAPPTAAAAAAGATSPPK